jgi:hypothetical protein
MVETAEQYTSRLIGYVGDRDPRALLVEAPGRLRALLGRADGRTVRWKDKPSRWSIAQIAAHLADAEVVGAWRFRLILAQDNVPVQAYDQNAWASAFKYEDTDPADSLAAFEALRGSTVRVLQRVDPARFRHAGLHAERGRESIEHLVRLYAGHDLNHFSQIERLLEEAGRAS